MRKLVMLTIALAMFAVSSSNVEAARRQRVIQQRQPVFTTNNGGGNVFGRLMEMERRKNEWLFGR